MASVAHISDALPAQRGRAEQHLTALVEQNRALVRQCARLHVTVSRLERLAYVDGLTGLANRRFLDEALDLEIRRATRTRLPLALVLCDIDHFKRYNDSFGHQQGDNVLALIGGTLRSSLRRAGDIAARFGGEEFALLLPNVGVMDALAFAEQVRRSVIRMRLNPPPTSPPGKLSMSLGVTTYHSGAAHRRIDLVQAADIALYRAKAAGRNCTRYHAIKGGD